MDSKMQSLGRSLPAAVPGQLMDMMDRQQGRTPAGGFRVEGDEPGAQFKKLRGEERWAS